MPIFLQLVLFENISNWGCGTIESRVPNGAFQIPGGYLVNFLTPLPQIMKKGNFLGPVVKEGLCKGRMFFLRFEVHVWSI